MQDTVPVTAGHPALSPTDTPQLPPKHLLRGPAPHPQAQSPSTFLNLTPSHFLHALFIKVFLVRWFLFTTSCSAVKILSSLQNPPLMSPPPCSPPDTHRACLTAPSQLWVGVSCVQIYPGFLLCLKRHACPVEPGSCFCSGSSARASSQEQNSSWFILS